MAATAKSFKFGNREKIIAIALGALVIIAVTHLLLYRPKSLELTQVNKDYKTALDNYVADASKNLPPSDIKALQNEVNELDTLLSVSIDTFHIGEEKGMVGGGKVFMKLVDDIKALEKNTTHPKIMVLEDWTITDDIPGLDPARIPDYLDQLKQKKAILSMPNIPSDLKDNFDSQYKEILQRIGFNQIDLGKLNNFIAWLKEVKMLYYIEAHKGASDIKDTELLSILNITTDPALIKLGMFFLIRTKDLINMAIQAQVDTVSDVQMLEKKEIRPNVKETPTPPPNQPTFAGGFGGRFMGAMQAEGRGAQAEGRGGIRGPAGYLSTFMGRGGVATPTPPPEPASAISIPIEITITGDNISITKFLYAVTHSPELMDIRAMSITAQEEGKLTAIIAVNCYRDVTTIDAFEKQKIAKAVPQTKPKK